MEFDASKFFRLYEVETSGDAVPPAHLVDPEDLYQVLDKLLVNDNAWQYLFFGRAPYRNAACTIAKSEKTVEGRTVLSQLYITVVLPDIGEKTLEDFSIAVRALIPQLKRVRCIFLGRLMDSTDESMVAPPHLLNKSAVSASPATMSPSKHNTTDTTVSANVRPVGSVVKEALCDTKTQSLNEKSTCTTTLRGYESSEEDYDDTSSFARNKEKVYRSKLVMELETQLSLRPITNYQSFDDWAKDVNLHRGAWACLYGPGGKPSTVKLITDHFEDYWRFDKIVRLGYQRDFFKNRWPLSGPPLNHKLVFSVDKKQKPKKRKRMSDGGTGIATVQNPTKRRKSEIHPENKHKHCVGSDDENEIVEERRCENASTKKVVTAAERLTQADSEGDGDGNDDDADDDDDDDDESEGSMDL